MFLTEFLTLSIQPLAIAFGVLKPEFIIFGLVLAGVALFHHHTLKVALGGLFLIIIYKLFFTQFDFAHHTLHEWRTVVNLFGLLLGFALLARHFEDSHLPQLLPKYLPQGIGGPFVLLLLVFVLSSFLDNIAAAIIGGSLAHVVFKGKVHIGYIAAIVAASNAGGSGSVVGDTTTTMMWIDGVHAGDVLKAYTAAIPAVFIFGWFASRQQLKYQPLDKGTAQLPPIDWMRIGIVLMILAGAIITNITLDFPALGVWVAILIGAMIRNTHWKEIPNAMVGSVFLLSLVISASMMPVESLPEASWFSALILGFVSAVFDNIPLTKLALTQGGYDWGVLAFAVGFGGSMMWFGSSAGVAITNIFPEARSVGKWIKSSWYVIPVYVISFMIMLWLTGWHPTVTKEELEAAAATHNVHATE